jgi:hypothetical protein
MRHARFCTARGSDRVRAKASEPLLGGNLKMIRLLPRTAASVHFVIEQPDGANRGHRVSSVIAGWKR